MARAPWVKWYPSDFIIGTARLTPDMGWLYTVVINWIYERGGPIDDDIAELAAATNMKPSRAEAALESLVNKGKLIRGDGKISNARAAEEIASRTASISKSSEAATKRWENARQKTEENQSQKVTPHALVTKNPDENRADQSRAERKKDSSLARKPTRSGDQSAYSAEFETEVWKPYPRKLNASKKNAWDRWRMLTEERQKLVKVAIPIYAANMAREGREESKIKHLQFFISERVYETVAVPPSASSNVVNVEWYKTATREQWAKTLKIWSATNDWRAAWGPSPDHEGCFVPPDMIAAHNVKHRGYLFAPEQLEEFRKVADVAGSQNVAGQPPSPALV